jgi:hypothetical protein
VKHENGNCEREEIFVHSKFHVYVQKCNLKNEKEKNQSEFERYLHLNDNAAMMQDNLRMEVKFNRE